MELYSLSKRLRHFTAAPTQPIRLSSDKSYLNGRTDTSRLLESHRCSVVSDPQVPRREWDADILLNILFRLDVKSLTRFKCVCKDSQHNLGSPLFLKNYVQNSVLRLTGFIVQPDMYLIQSSYIRVETSGTNMWEMFLGGLPEDVHILASCNGLLCFYSISQEPALYICNPANKQCLKLPPSSGEYISIGIAFDYEGGSIDSATNSAKFKLVKVVNAQPMISTDLRFQIYSSETRSWKMSNATCEGGILLKNKGIYLRGVLYWLGKCKRILVFDVRTELALWILRPRAAKDTCSSSSCIGESNGTLHYVSLTKTLGLRVWSLQHYFGEWTLEYKMSFEDFKEQCESTFPNFLVDKSAVTPLAFKDWVLPLLIRGKDQVIVYDFKNGKMTWACSLKRYDLGATVFSHSMSLVPLNDA
ncbi:hypothetical protein HN51_067935 [Arachis hypogaea]|uniref:F-box protein At5g49610-like n=1 Tax=Arachis ipaensis TaxID=130454 RepID=UPI000A2B3ADF|nr:F-box protein At5g49610-like [Arachis ipaensis]XP_025650148.1 F-box protein At5g49610 [Arachis hypogaea]QHO09432.1 F-box protein [Arachis hypogaea]